MPDKNQASYKNEVTANISTLALDGGETPAEGDEVEVTVKGTISRIVGDTACINPTTVNGDPAPPVPPDEAEAVDNPKEESLDAMRTRLQAGAMAQDQEGQ